MSAKRDGGPAFPSPGAFDGMSMRDWFAGQAMKVLLELDECDNAMQMAKDAYALADVMVEAREEGWI